jgi:hypothetical protein
MHRAARVWLAAGVVWLCAGCGTETEASRVRAITQARCDAIDAGQSANEMTNLISYGACYNCWAPQDGGLVRAVGETYHYALSADESRDEACCVLIAGDTVADKRVCITGYH